MQTQQPSPINETQHGIQKVNRSYATVHVRFKTQEAAKRFYEFLAQEVCNGQ